ncbi:Nucleotidyl transferase [Candidatus Amoebophilus asiaticus 5a2]|uniref:Nucleotidyl transferase n=1 Tax=Amoebophilus asiaticus (strain 5a2) TaxID=452471 RepID=B3EUE7_AMOA5|nr:mannose-1-phosphate guanylyltransferase [Candidatus Amoebophilus asiaticus]ACE05566.1 Nucleotidyl transferase [Candidatus Amoebophilus asiaticus 5a2]
MNRQYDTHIVIMAGGSGQRLWPCSTQSMPKQFHDFLGAGKTFLQATAERFMQVIPQQNIWVVTQKRHVATVKKQLPWINKQQILGEPISKNTASCIAYACATINNYYPEATLVITPADHYIQQEQLFINLIQQALQSEYTSLSITLVGVPCKNPATGYGYIGYDNQEKGTVKPITDFVEKPPRAQAEAYIAQGNYVWNTGIFIGKLSVFIKSLQTYLPHIWAAFERLNLLLNVSKKKYQVSLLNLYKSLPSTSFDHGILEKADQLYLICQDFGWKDLGTWNALYEHLDKDRKNNVCQGQVVTLLTSNCLIKGNEEQLIATYGLDSLVIVQHQGVLLICPRNEVQNLKTLVQQIDDEGYTPYL